MSMYVPGKPVQVSKSFIDQVQAGYKAAVEKAERIAIVGVRPNRTDAHVWEPIETSNAQILFVGSRSAFDEWVADAKPKRPKFVGARFEDAISALATVL